MRPCQSVRHLPPDVAAWMTRWRRRAAAGRCFTAMRERPVHVHQASGIAVYSTVVGAHCCLHTWGSNGQRIVDPTAHQFGPGPIRLYAMRETCPACGRCVFGWLRVGGEDPYPCQCIWTLEGLQRLVLGGAVYSEPGALDIGAVYAALSARMAA